MEKIFENNIYQGDCLELIKGIPDGSVDCIVTDPPYLYLKHRLDRHFDEDTLFAEWKRVLKPNGMIAVFGRGESFHRWNVKLNQLGFPFKEEIIWNKIRPSSPVLPLVRVHETISILGDGKINVCYVPYLEVRKYNDFHYIVDDIKRIKSGLNNPKEFDLLLKYAENKELHYLRPHRSKYGVTLSNKLSFRNNRSVDCLKSIINGFKERDIITENFNDKNRVHPTQKSVRLIERLLALVSNPGEVVLDCFLGSGTTAVAAINTGRKYIGFELDAEYFATCQRRIAEAQSATAPQPYNRL